MLSKFDDFPIHQTPEPVSQPATTDRNVYDRYWFNGYADDGEFYFGIGMAVYPHRRVIDCGFSIVRDGEQHAFHASARAPEERGETAVGPFRIDVQEPMRRLRVTLDENETGLACDLTFLARTAPVEEGRQTFRRDGRAIMDATRFAQFGRWEGRVAYAGRQLAIEPGRVYGTKDRSWGIRPVGEPEPPGAPGEPGGFYFLWAPIHWPDRCTHFGRFEHPDGTPWHEDGAIVPVYGTPEEIPGANDPGIEAVASTERKVVYAKGTRRAESAEIALVKKSGERVEISLEPLICFRMKGIGYTHPEWGHGRWKGELAIGGESWKCDELDPLALENLHVQQVMRARCGDAVGIGVMEQIALGPHAPSGFEEFLDGAK